jgi:hypothetical protein
MMITSKHKKGAKVIRKQPHGDSARSVGMKNVAGNTANKPTYKMNGSRRILFPLSPTQTDHRILSAAVDAVVAEPKK